MTAGFLFYGPRRDSGFITGQGVTAGSLRAKCTCYLFPVVCWQHCKVPMSVTHLRLSSSEARIHQCCEPETDCIYVQSQWLAGRGGGGGAVGGREREIERGGEREGSEGERGGGERERKRDREKGERERASETARERGERERERDREGGREREAREGGRERESEREKGERERARERERGERENRKERERDTD